jgi:ribonuclease HII
MVKKEQLAKLWPYFNKEGIEAGIDEAGRGCYAGPVFAAAVILKPDFYHPLLNDSKQLREKERLLLREVILEEALSYAIQSVDAAEIDKINILQATYCAMHAAIGKLKVLPDRLLVDGNRFKPYPKISHHCIIKGDGKYASIAAASILAKTSRDAYMKGIHVEFPHYCWDQNKGYGTLRHREAIEQFGICVHHRKSFNIHPGSLVSLF